MIKTLEDFVAETRGASSDYVYELFEENTSEKVRDEIYSYANKNSPEPFRSAMITLGKRYNSQSLKHY